VRDFAIFWIVKSRESLGDQSEIFPKKIKIPKNQETLKTRKKNSPQPIGY
jgi:hypothetical protein